LSEFSVPKEEKMRQLKTLVVFLIIANLCFLCFTEAFGQTAKITASKGKVTVKRLDKDWVPAKVGMILNEGDIIKTEWRSRATLKLIGKKKSSAIYIRPGSELLIAKLSRNEKTGNEESLLDLAIGNILIKAQKLEKEGDKFEVKTPTSVTGVRGTKFSVEVVSIEDILLSW
jgi:hypothetical protein